ncbi:DUF6701 domain-containing protein [Vibrio ziniensis]|uniref:DUF6701 domain-containing protein n=1 Tax=Vibrio ziniensis TaxID=2711221 RepID=A0A6G7CL97_9VIBR|nr:DUF6701 domain-containing protein [Vibrio ziniensis]QIH42826.1 hypothetical protein G5S32_12935 [Vibrio ziniensis]
MAKLFRCLPLLLLLFVQGVFAAQCKFQGQKYAVIEFNVVGSPGEFQSVTLEESGSGYDKKYLWYTEQASSSSDYLFNEPSLKSGVPYKVRIIRDPGNNIPTSTRYYRRNLNLGTNSWVLVDEMMLELKSGNVTASTAIEQSALSCTEVEEEDIDEYIPPIFDQCSYFPQAIQSWKTTGTDYESYGPSVFNANSTAESISGWSENYVKDSRNIYNYEAWDGSKTALRIGFDTTNNTNTYGASCEGLGCAPASLNDDGLYESRKAEPPEPLNVTFDSTQTLEIKVDTYQPDYVASCSSSGLCSYQDMGNTVEVVILQNLKSLTVQGLRDDKKVIVRFVSGIKIENLNISGNSRAYFNESSGYLFSTASIGGWGTSTDIYLESDVFIGVTSSFNASSVVFSTVSASSGDYIKPTIYGPAASLYIKTDSVLQAHLLAKSMNFDSAITIEGSITAHFLNMWGGVNVIGDMQDSDCWEETEEEYTLVLSPTTDVALICEELTPTLSVMSNGSIATDFNGSATVTIDGVSQSVDINNGVVNLSVSSGGQSQTISVSASLNGYSDVDSVSGSYQFVPYKFAVDDQYVIANKSLSVTAKTLACNNEGSVVDVGYSGSPTISSSWVAPASGAVGNLSYSPVFSDGQSTDDLILEDSGQMEITLEDSSFDCSELENCPFEVDETTGTQALKGKFTVYSRPWTFAICSSGSPSLDTATGDSNGGNGFIAAGETFAAKVVPIRYIGDGSISGEIESGSFCSESITSNFFSDSSLASNNIVLSSSVATPVQSDDVVFQVEQPRVNTDKEYSFTALSWEDVGSLKVMAATANHSAVNCSSTLLNLETWYECTQQGYRNIGRFYPAYFVITESDWWVNKDDAEVTAMEPYTQDNIAYLSQAFGLAKFEVVPYSLNDSVIKNYSHFKDSLQAGISLLDDETFVERLEVNVTDGEWQDNSAGESGTQGSRWYLEDDEAKFLRNNNNTVNSHGNRETTVDGPFNVSDDSLSKYTGFGFIVSANVSENPDPIDSRNQDNSDCLNKADTESDYSQHCHLSFIEQPQARYGRMVMSDVGGTSTQEKINVPLKVQYWDGLRFVTNTDDSGSRYHSDNDYVCTQSVWVDVNYTGGSDSSNASLVPIDTNVASGISTELFAKPHNADNNNSRREQIRYWLRMGTDSPQYQESKQSGSGILCGEQYIDQPWLQYNWRGLGDEDPSAVVTFGVYRGNDRIIFRGESGLIGQ